MSRRTKVGTQRTLQPRIRQKVKQRDRRYRSVRLERTGLKGLFQYRTAATRASGYCASATLRDKMVASGQTLMTVTAQLPWGRTHPVDRRSHGHDRAAGSRAATAYGSQLAASLAGRGWSLMSALHSGRLRGEGDQPGGRIPRRSRGPL